MRPECVVLIVFACTFGQVQLEIPQAKVGLVVGKGTPQVKTHLLVLKF